MRVCVIVICCVAATAALARGLFGQGIDLHFSELRKLDGTWRGLSMQINGKEMDEKDFRESQMSFTARTVILTFKGKVTGRGSFTIDPSKDPKHITVTIEEGAFKGKSSFGIYKFEGQKLVICWTQLAVIRSRPTSFEFV